MSFPPDYIEELNLLALYNLSSAQEGIKVHRHSAAPESVAAAERLFRKGLITQVDGGYLTPLGNETAEHTHKLLAILTSG
ncbi:MAG: TIGR02647 family protein [Marinobacter sp.]|uniref:TIGR02647 family protein n=1 Tax=Marinobacter sp. TaxID=50741 RepID=UPI0034A03D32